MFDAGFMEAFLSGEVGLMDIGRGMVPGHKHLTVKKEDSMVDLNKGTEKVKFAHIEIIRKEAVRSDEPRAGLFCGLRVRADGKDKERKTSKFILLGDQKTPSDIRTFNLDKYNIMSTTLKYGDTKELIVFKADEFDQKQAMEVIVGLLTELRENKYMVDNDPEIVDVTKYVDVPDDLGGDRKKTTISSTPRTNNYSYPYTGCGYNNDDWKKKQEERKKQEELEKKMRWTPTKIAREGDMPNLKMLNLMKKKVLQIATGEYEYQLPEVKGDDGKEPIPTTVVEDCATCIHSTNTGAKDPTKAICQRCNSYSSYDDGEDYYGNQFFAG